jgi:exodeoxyribonuclease VII large subunit
MSQLPLFQSTVTPLSVTDLTRYLRELIESDHTLQDIWVLGEISNFTRHSSGHLYFTLKDSAAELRCVMWRNMALRQNTTPANGDAVEVHGAISVYEARGQYQLYADLIRPLGEGQLYQAFMRLKARLEAEGLFDATRKRPIPRWPHTIGVVTSPTGAALRDILNTLRRRYPLGRVVLAPTAVQGEEAPAGIVTALQTLNQIIKPDVILVARGGGSLEDLWAFNDEKVGRAIAASAAPVITGVGHETDFTIADFAADLRAPTPTAAAELAAPDIAELRLDLSEAIGQLGQAALTAISEQRWVLNRLQQRLDLRSPRPRIQSDRQRLDELAHRSRVALRHSQRLDRAGLESLSRRLEALDPPAVLRRGYAVVSRLDGQPIGVITAVQPSDDVQVRLVDGQFQARVTDVTPDERNE